MALLSPANSVASMMMPAAQDAVPDRDSVQRFINAAYIQAPAAIADAGAPTVATDITLARAKRTAKPYLVDRAFALAIKI